MIPVFLIRPLLYAAGVAALLFAAWWAHHRIDAQGYARGRAETEAKYVQRDTVAREAAEARIRALEQQRIDTERKHAADLQNVSTKLSQEQQNANKVQADLRARLAAGNLRLRDPGSTGTAQSCGSGMPASAASASGSDASAGAVLSNAAAQFLLDFAAEADAVARQLAACQDVIRSDRK